MNSVPERDEALALLREEGCPENVIRHVIAVTDEALRIADRITAAGCPVDIRLVEAGGLLHDLGRSVSHGMDHAVIGASLAEKHGLDPALVLIIKKHIGAGLSREDAVSFGLPDDDYIPGTLEEKIVAHADNLLKGSQKITLKKRLKIMKERNISKTERKKVRDLAFEILSYEINGHGPENIFPEQTGPDHRCPACLPVSGP